MAHAGSFKNQKKCIFEWSKEPKKRFLAIFLSLVHRITLILHILTILNDVNNLGMIWLMMDHSKIRKMHFWMIQRAKKEVFGHFLDFGLLDRLGNADFDSTKCFPRFGNITRSWRIIQKSKKCLFERPKVPKKRFLAVLWTYVIWIDLW